MHQGLVSVLLLIQRDSDIFMGFFSPAAVNKSGVQASPRELVQEMLNLSLSPPSDNYIQLYSENIQ